jgi:internalin A
VPIPDALFLAIALAMYAPAVSADELAEAKAILIAKGCSFRADDSGQVTTISSTRGKMLSDADMSLIGKFHALKVLNLHQNDISDEGFRSLAGIHDLEHVYANITAITDKSVPQIAKWKHLRTVYLPEGVTDDGLRLLGNLEKLESLVAGGPGITDGCVDTLVKFKRLRFISLGPNVTPAGYERLSELPNVETIQTFGWMDDSMMAVLTKFPKLNHLYLSTTQVTEAGLPHLRRLENLHTLTLPKETTDSGLAYISHMRKLRHLDLRTSKVTNEGLAALKDIKSLSMLTLPPTTSDAAVAQLAAYDLRLSSVNLMGEGFTDACIPSLLSLKHLTNIGLWRTKITDEGFQMLQRAKPHVQFSRK